MRPWLLCLILFPSFAWAQQPSSTNSPSAPVQSLPSPVIAIPWGVDGSVTSYWGSNGQETRVYQSTPGIQYSISPSGQTGFVYDNFTPSQPLNSPAAPPSSTPWLTR